MTKNINELWQAPPPRLRPAREAVELPLRPSPRLRIARRLLGVVVLLHALELFLTGHWPAAVVMVLVVTGLWLGPWMFRARRQHPLSLVLAADGGLWLRYPRAAPEQVFPGPDSVALGAHVLLVLRGAGQPVRLLLGPDNLEPCALAALKRRFPPRALQPTGVHSITASGSKSSEQLESRPLHIAHPAPARTFRPCRGPCSWHAD